MTDFCKRLHALVVVAFLASIAVPGYADFTCNVSAVNVPVRAESNDDNGGDIIMSCSGGIPTAPGAAIPPTNITVTVNTNITSRILATITGGVTTNFNEALLIIDEPNTALYNGVGGRPLSNCGYNGEDSDLAAGPGVCKIIAPTDPSRTYDGSVGVQNNGAGNDFAACATAATFGCGRPNVFQGRNAVSLISGQANAIQFLGIPLDPPAVNASRTIRITNVRIDATRFGVTSPFSVFPVTATVSFSGSLLIPDATVTIAEVQLGMTSQVFGFTGFLQSAGTDTVSGNSASSPFYSGSGLPMSGFGHSPTGGMDIRVLEDFGTAWKARNLSMILGNGVFSPFGYVYGGTPGWFSTDLNQNVPGVSYNTESGFENSGVNAFEPFPNPPSGFFSGSVTDVGRAFRNLGTNTGVSAAGKASQGTHIAVQIANIPSGVRLFFPITVVLKNQSNGAVSGVMQADALADQNGFNSFTSGFPAAFVAAPRVPVRGFRINHAYNGN